MAPILELDKLSKRYGAREVLRDLTLSVEAGTILGYFGLNGAGKSTTNRILLGFARPSSGSCHILGQPAGSAAALSRLGYLAENPYFHTYLSGEEVVDYAARLSGVGAGDRRQRVHSVLERVRLPVEAWSRRVKDYSRGMGQRIGIAQALVHDPDFLLLDEPFSGLDPLGRAMLKDILRDFRAGGGTVFFSSHQLLDAQEICDHVAVLHGGKLILKESLEQLETRHPGKTLERIFLDLIEPESNPDSKVEVVPSGTA